MHRVEHAVAGVELELARAPVQRVRPDAPFSCRSGVCSTCQAILREGDVTMAVNYGLTDDEVARGYVLTCQSRPVTDEIVVDYDA